MKSYQSLIQSLDQLVTVYRHLLEAVRRENEALLTADMQALPDINLTKEKLILKVKELDGKWQLSADELAIELEIKINRPRLLDFAAYFKGDEATKLEQLHSVLNMLVNRIVEFNKKNEPLVYSALSHISGAMDSITKTLNENPTYKNSGSLEADNKDAQGRLVQREV